MSSFINGLGLLLVDLNLRPDFNAPYLFSALIISVTDIVQFDTMLLYTMCLKLFTVGRHKLL